VPQARARQLDQLFDELDEDSVTVKATSISTDANVAAASTLLVPPPPPPSPASGPVYGVGDALSSVDEDLCVFLGVSGVRRVTADGAMDSETAAEVAAFLSTHTTTGTGVPQS
jgi:hypothetical protein